MTRMLVGAVGVAVLNETSADGSDLIPIEFTAVTSRKIRAPSGTTRATEFVPVTVTTFVLLALDRPYLTECEVTAGSTDGSHDTTSDAPNAVDANNEKRIRGFIRGGIGRGLTGVDG